MGCGCGDIELSDQERFGVPENQPCAAITIDLLQMYKAPIDCYLKYSLWSGIGISQEDLIACSEYLDDFIARKLINIDDCEGVINLANVRKIVSLIINKGVCL